MAKRAPAKRAADAIRAMVQAAKKIVAAEEAFAEAAEAEDAERRACELRAAEDEGRPAGAHR